MALKKTFQTKMGVSGEYVKIQLSFKDKLTVLLRMEYWLDKATRDLAGAIPLSDQMAGSGDSRIVGFKCMYQFIYDLTSVNNIYVQAYDYLKTLPEFIGAGDC